MLPVLKTPFSISPINLPKVAPHAKIGVKIPQGTGQLIEIAVNSNFIGV